MEKRFHMLRPEQIIEQRDKCPVAYIPLGTLEWHGLHNPIGADGLQAEELALRCADQGGVVFPTVYYGESRVNSLLETDPKYQAGICERLSLNKNQFDADRFPYSGIAQIEHYQHHLIHIISEAASYGFELVVFVIGHYPLIESARSAIILYNQWAYDKEWKRITGLAAADYLLLKDEYTSPGDHAGGWETSHLLASHPETVNLKAAANDLQYGIMSTRNPLHATAQFGNEIYDAAVKKITEHVFLCLNNPKPYIGHGIPLI